MSQCVLLTEFYLREKMARCHASQILEIAVVRSCHPNNEMDLHVAVLKLKNIDLTAVIRLLRKE